MPNFPRLFLLLAIAFGDEFPPLPDGFYSDVDEISLSAGHYHTCAIEARQGVEFGGSLKCWGYNSHGQSDPPPGIFVQVSSGHMHTCAVSIDETVQCWGVVSTANVPKGLFTQVSSGGEPSTSTSTSTSNASTSTNIKLLN